MVFSKSNINDINQFIPSYSIDERTRSFIKVQDGCDYSCSFCTIPLARGKSRSGRITDILDSINDICQSGIKEIVLSGINVGDFGVHNGESLFSLLNEIELIKDLHRCRISSIEPNLLSDESIHLIGKSNKILFEILNEITKHFKISICSIDGGGLRNAIPRESSTVISFSKDNINLFEQIIKKNLQKYKTKFQSTDSNLNLEFQILNDKIKQLNNKESVELIDAINNCPNGVFEMSKSIDGLVETSNNLANIKLIEGELKIMCLTRSSSEDSKAKLSKVISNIFEDISCDCTFSGGYPGWEPNINSKTLKEVKNSYIKLFSSEPKVNVIHAGLECGIIGSHYPDMDMISFGPTILGAHSPDEKASISSTQKFWRFFTEILANIPQKVD